MEAPLKRVWLTLGCAVLLGCQGQEPETASVQLGSLSARYSYGLGVKIGQELQRKNEALEGALIVRGFADAFAGRAQMTEDEIAAVFEERLAMLRAQQQAKQAAAVAEVKAESAAFLAEYQERPGVQRLPSGVLYEVLHAGSGATPTADDWVSCHYTGRLYSGEVFEDTRKSGQPRKFVVTAVVDGLEQALQTMQAGAKWRLVVPAELGYGDKGWGERIPPGAALVFELELLSVESGALGQARARKPM